MLGISKAPGNFPMVFAIVASDGSVVAPPLELLIPNEVQYSYKPIINKYLTRNAIVQEHWGNELDQISVKGGTAGFLDENCGYTRTQARQTEAYANFVQIILIYKNNGAYYDQKGVIVERQSRGNPAASTGGIVVMQYSAGVFEGYFNEFSWSEDAEQPYRFNFDFTFFVQRTLLAY